MPKQVAVPVTRDELYDLAEKMAEVGLNVTWRDSITVLEIDFDGEVLEIIQTDQAYRDEQAGIISEEMDRIEMGRLWNE